MKYIIIMFVLIFSTNAQSIRNIAKEANITVSSELNKSHGKHHLIDGIIREGCWATNYNKPYAPPHFVHFQWKTTMKVKSIRIWDRSYIHDTTKLVLVIIGSKRKLLDLKKGGSVTYKLSRSINTKFVKIYLVDFNAKAPGLCEVEIKGTGLKDTSHHTIVTD